MRDYSYKKILACNNAYVYIYKKHDYYLWSAEDLGRHNAGKYYDSCNQMIQKDGNLLLFSLERSKLTITEGVKLTDTRSIDNYILKNINTLNKTEIDLRNQSEIDCDYFEVLPSGGIGKILNIHITNDNFLQIRLTGFIPFRNSWPTRKRTRLDFMITIDDIYSIKYIKRMELERIDDIDIFLKNNFND